MLPLRLNRESLDLIAIALYVILATDMCALAYTPLT